MAIVNPNDQTIFTNKSLGSSFVSPAIALTGNTSYSFQAFWTGSPVGNFYIQGSDDTAANIANILPVNFTTIVSQAAGGAASSWLISYDGGKVPYNWVQFGYTFTSGSGTLTSLTFNGK